MKGDKLRITIPGYYDREVAYVLHVLLCQNLNFDNYVLERKEQTDFVFEGPQGGFVIGNHFFRDIKKSPVHLNNLPQKLTDFRVTGLDTVFSSFYGDCEVLYNQESIKISADIIASSFLLLTQWDAAAAERDQHGRVRLDKSVVGRFKLYHRPLINEYVSLLRYLLGRIGFETNEQAYGPVFSCDVDVFTKYRSLRNLAGALYHSGFKAAGWKKSINSYFASMRDYRLDPYYTFDYISATLKKCELPAIFYFMTGKTNDRFDHADYQIHSNSSIELLNRLQYDGYEIGLHPSFESWNSADTLIREKSQLDAVLGKSVTKLRQHYLRYDPAITWSLQEQAGFESDSSVQFTQGEGFAAGSCTPYRLFDVNGRRMTQLTETPLILMKKKDYVKSLEERFTAYASVIEVAKKYNGRFQVLFHNSDLETDNERALFEMTLNYLQRK